MMYNQPEISPLRIAVILPCYNEEATIAQVIEAFAQHLPHADIYVCDNASQDKTAEQASAAGAIVLSEHKQGKANAVNRLFSAVEADVYVLSDGDLTYDASAAPQLITALIENKREMIVGTRTPVSGQKTYRLGHSFGNSAFTTILRSLFGGNFSDVLSGYRVFFSGFPTAFLSLGLGLLSILSVLSELILDSISRQRLEMKKLAYLSQMLKSG